MGVVVWLRDRFVNKQEGELGLCCSAQAEAGTAAGD